MSSVQNMSNEKLRRSTTNDSGTKDIRLRRVLRVSSALAFALALLVLAWWRFDGLRVSDAQVRADLPALVESALPAQRSQSSAARRYNGFDLTNPQIPVEKIGRGGPPRDGIPAILHPKFVPVAGVNFLAQNDKVVSFEHDGDVRAYPIRILVWHEIANDTVGGLPIAVTYCPLCGTAMVFDRRYRGEEHTFGVSGLLYNSDVLMYDHQTQSLWSQLAMKSVTGEMSGEELRWLPSRMMTWRAWRTAHPDGKVLSTETGQRRNYGRMPYAGYEDQEDTYFPFTRHRDELSNKEWIVGVIVNGEARAYPESSLRRLEGETLSDTVGGVEILVDYDRAAQSAHVVRADTGELIPFVHAFWFAWQAFYPTTGLHTDDAPRS